MTEHSKISEADAFDKGFRTIEDPSEIIAPGLQALYEFWSARRGSAPYAPPGHEFMLEFPVEAALWTICDVQDGGADFYYRFAGSALVDMIGTDVTGRTLSELNAAAGNIRFGTNTTAIFRMVVESGLPVLNGPKPISIEDKSYLRIQTLNLPLGDTGPIPKQVLGAIELIRTAPEDQPE